MDAGEFILAITKLAEDNKLGPDKTVNAIMLASVLFALEAGVPKEVFLGFAEETWDEWAASYKQAHAVLEA